MRLQELARRLLEWHDGIKVIEFVLVLSHPCFTPRSAHLDADVRIPSSTGRHAIGRRRDFEEKKKRS